MAAIIKFLCVGLVFISLIIGGNCDQCSVNDIKIVQSPTGLLVKNKPEWLVTIKNECICSQLDLKLDCDGFETVKQVDASKLTVAGAVCLVNGGLPIYGFKSISFTYAWDTSFPFHTLFSQVDCS